MTKPTEPAPSNAASRPFLVALAGNPNSGKTTLFNRLTGARQHVGNYPGVTVEKKEGSYRHEGREVQVIDLPGTYSLSAYSPEELVARQVVIEEHPQVVVDVVDASNLERNLYLATQFMELGLPLILALNMVDVAEARGHTIDYAHLSRLFQVPVVPIVANRGTGLAELKQAIREMADTPPGPPARIEYGSGLERALERITPLIEERDLARPPCSPRWLALKLLEGDEVVRADIQARAGDAAAILDPVEDCRRTLAREFGDDADILVADHRYGFISGACQEAVRSNVESRHTASDRIDAVMTNRVLGIPIFFALMFLVFKLTFSLGDAPMGWIEGGFEWLGGVISGFWPEGSDSLLESLLVDGIIGGVGGVLVFLPNILLLFLAIAILEDSGYMARAAFIMDRFMQHIGLHGKSFIPMLIGFGCTVPAIMATRTLENRRDRFTTMLVAPLMSCGARLPIYALLIPAFFPAAWHARMLWIIYTIGIALAVICAKLLRKTLFRGDSAPFVMELPPYRIPTIRGVFIHMWERGWVYLRKAGTLILGISVLMWALATFPRSDADGPATAGEHDREAAHLAHTYAGRIGRAMEPVIKPLGFDWRIGTALIGAFAAKEVFVAQMGIVFAVGEADEESPALREQLRAAYSPLQAFCIMLFCLISAPCMATIAVTKRETNSWKWAIFQLAGLTALAYFVTLLVYQVGSNAGIGV